MGARRRLSLLSKHLESRNNPMTPTKNFNVAIVGGGIAGLTLAIALHQRQVPVTIYEQAHAFGEIGAGVSFSPNAVQAMKVCHQGIYEAFEQVCTRNLWPSKKKVWFDYLDGYNPTFHSDGNQEAAFTISNSLGQNGVHRAHFLEVLVKLVPTDIAQFGKRLKDITEHSSGNGKLVMSFYDGSIAEADAIIGCDGIKSHVRQIMFGADHPSAKPTYSHKYAYRGLVPMEKAIAAIGEERAQNACMHVSNSKLFIHRSVLTILDGTRWPYVDFSCQPWPDIKYRGFPHHHGRLAGLSETDSTGHARRRTARP
jgi:salicylate hydroxylase